MLPYYDPSLNLSGAPRSSRPIHIPHSSRDHGRTGANRILQNDPSDRRRYAMKKLLFPMALAALSISGAAAQSVFEGTWKDDLSKISISQPMPEEYLVKDGISACKTCDPPITVKADGKDHPFSDNPHFDSGAFELLSDHHAKATNKK